VRFRVRQERPEGNELDLLILQQLRGKGAKLALPRHVLHFVDCPDEESARAAADDVEAIGFDATVEAPTGGGSMWTVRGEAMRVVDETTVATHRRQFERIADAFGGEYDGWEAAAEP
jgi:regulator of ribonuclease activity B